MGKKHRKKDDTFTVTQNKITNVLTGIGLNLQVKQIDGVDYINASEIAKYRETSMPSVETYRPRHMIEHFLSNRKMLDYIIEWETIHNKRFKGPNIGAFKINKFKGHKVVPFNEVKRVDHQICTITPTKLTEMNSELVKVERGRYGAVWFRHNLALKFAAYVSPRLDVYFTQDYINLKLANMNRTILSDESWDKLRKSAKSSHKLLTTTIEDWVRSNCTDYTEKDLVLAYAAETDMINLIIFGMTAAAWKDHKNQNPAITGNMRDNATKEQLHLVHTLEELDAIYIQSGYTTAERESRLRDVAKQFMIELRTNKEQDIVNKTIKKSTTIKIDVIPRKALAARLHQEMMTGEVRYCEDGNLRDMNGFIRLGWKL